MQAMRREQELGLAVGFVCITCVFCGTAIQTWANYPTYIALSLSCVYMIGFFIFGYTGHHTFKIFQLNYDIKSGHLKKDRGMYY